MTKMAKKKQSSTKRRGVSKPSAPNMKKTTSMGKGPAKKAVKSTTTLRSRSSQSMKEKGNTTAMVKPRLKKPTKAEPQPHIRKAMAMPLNSGSRATVYDLSRNKVTPNKPQKKAAKPARYNSDAGMPGPAADKFAPVVRPAPRAVTDPRQLMMPTKNNYIPDEFGITNPNAFPMQELASTSGGKWSGRTGPM